MPPTFGAPPHRPRWHQQCERCLGVLPTQPLPEPRHLRRALGDYDQRATEGDMVWIPPWTWHRVDYVAGVPALSASLFHIRPLEMLLRNAEFVSLVVPNIAKELLGLNHE